MSNTFKAGLIVPSTNDPTWNGVAEAEECPHYTLIRTDEAWLPFMTNCGHYRMITLAPSPLSRSTQTSWWHPKTHLKASRALPMTKGAIDVTHYLFHNDGQMNQWNGQKISNSDAETGEAHLISRSLTKYGLFHLEECKYSETDPASRRTCSGE